MNPLGLVNESPRRGLRFMAGTKTTYTPENLPRPATYRGPSVAFISVARTMQLDLIQLISLLFQLTGQKA